MWIASVAISISRPSLCQRRKDIKEGVREDREYIAEALVDTRLSSLKAHSTFRRSGFEVSNERVIIFSSFLSALKICMYGSGKCQRLLPCDNREYINYCADAIRKERMPIAMPLYSETVHTIQGREDAKRRKCMSGTMWIRNRRDCRGLRYVRNACGNYWGIKLTSCCQVGPLSSWLRSELLGSWCDTKAHWWRRSGLLRKKWRGSLLRHWWHWRHGGNWLLSEAIHASGLREHGPGFLRLQCWRKKSVDACLLWELQLRIERALESGRLVLQW